MAAASAASPVRLAAEDAGAPDHVVLVTLDGARWQDVFDGLDVDVLRSASGRTPVERTAAYRRFWAETPQARRERLMPFLWTTLVRQEGFLAGNRHLGSRVEVANRQRVSLPGYAELLTGAPHDDVMRGNRRARYPFLNVLEWLRPAMGLGRGEVAVFGSWSTLHWLPEQQPGTVTVNAGFDHYVTADRRLRELSLQQFDIATPWTRSRQDTFTFRFGMAHLAQTRPRVLFLAFNDTDESAHAGRYTDTLDALHDADARLAELWAWLQADDGYRGRTSLLVTVDHGRGRTASDWRDHGAGIPGANETWVGCFGPRVTARGELRDHLPIEQRQIAATLAAVVGQDFRAAAGSAAPAIGACLGRP